MRKTPLSAPGGSYARKNNHEWNSRRRRYDFDHSSGYVNAQDEDNNKMKGDNFISLQNQQSPQKNSTDDFIPLGYSSPVNNRQRFNPVNNWRGQSNPHGYRNRGTPPSPGNGGFNNTHRQNFHHHDTPKTSFNYFHSQRFHQKQHNRQWRPRGKDSHRYIDISTYLNVKSCLEDPWADLMRNLEKSHSENENKIETATIVSGDNDFVKNDPFAESKSPDSQSGTNDSRTKVDQEESKAASNVTISTINTTVTTAGS